MNRLFAVVALSLFALVACEKPAEEKKATLEVESQSIEIPASEGVNIIKFTLSNPADFDKVVATSDAEWITNISTTSAGIAFNVTANTSLFIERVADIKIAYNGTETFVTVKQLTNAPAIDVEYTAYAINGEYYGTAYSEGYNYFAILSTNGTTGWSDLYLDTYYRFDLFSDVAAGNAVVLPNGVYEFDFFDGGKAGTVGRSYSSRIQTFEDGTYTENYITEGAIYVTDNRLVAILRYDDNKWHKVVYEGALDLGYITIPNDPPYSRLEKDYSFSYEGGLMQLFGYGDDYGVGGNNWKVNLMFDENYVDGDYFSIEIVTDNLDTTIDSICGTYTAATVENVAKGTFISGSESSVNSYLYSWYLVCEDNYVDHTKGGPISEGTVTIENVNGYYVVTLDCMDDNGHKIAGTFSCSSYRQY